MRALISTAVMSSLSAKFKSLLCCKRRNKATVEKRAFEQIGILRVDIFRATVAMSSPRISAQTDSDEVPISLLTLEPEFLHGDVVSTHS
jgi:hypothetical protein